MIINAIKNKIVKHIEKWNLFRNIVRRFDKWIISALIFGFYFWWEEKTTLFLNQNRIFVGAVVCVNLFAFFDVFLTAFFNIMNFLFSIKIWKSKETALIDGVTEKDDLIDFLLKNNGFPFINAKNELWLNAKEYKKIGDNLERVWVLTRGENNARVLSENTTKDILKKILNCDNTDDIFPPLLQNWNSFTVQKL